MIHSNRGDRVYARWQAIIKLPDGRQFKCKTTAVNNNSVYIEVPVSIPLKTQIEARLLVIDNKKNITLNIQGKVKTCFLTSMGQHFIINLSLENADSSTKNYIENYFKSLNRFKPRLNY